MEGIDDQFDIDLASLIYYADDNDGYKYLLVVIDIFSRYGWVEPLKDKTAKEIVKAFDKIIQEGRIPKRLCSDAAKDFTPGQFQKYVKNKNITHFVTHTENKLIIWSVLFKHSNQKYLNTWWKKIHQDT